MVVTHAFTGVAVSDYSVAYDWYVRLFGRAADLFPNEREAVWRFSPTSSAYVVSDPERAGNGLLTLAVDDLEAAANRLRAAGLTLTEQSGGTGPRRLTISDDDGNRITFFQDPGTAPPSADRLRHGSGMGPQS